MDGKAETTTCFSERKFARLGTHDAVIKTRKIMRMKGKKCGLENAQRHLGVTRDEHRFCRSDPVLVCLDLDVSVGPPNSDGTPVVRQLGISKFDTRCLRMGNREHCHIVTEHFKIVSKGEKLLRRAQKQQHQQQKSTTGECHFGSTTYLCQSQLADVLTSELRIWDTQCSAGGLRSIVLVTHFFPRDIRLLRLLNVDLGCISPVLDVLCTRDMAKRVLCSREPTFAWAIANSGHFSLESVMAALQSPFTVVKFGNAGDNAAFTMHTLFMLVAKSILDGKPEKDEISRVHEIQHVYLRDWSAVVGGIYGAGSFAAWINGVGSRLRKLGTVRKGSVG